MLGIRGKRLPVVLSIVTAAALITFLAVSSASPRGPEKPWIGVRGNQLVDRSGDVIRLLGVNRPGTEYECVEGNGFFEGPSDEASIEAMKSWKINVVRVPLNETCWLGNNGIDSDLSGAAYRSAIREYVERLERAGLYVILELQWAAPGEHRATGIIPMADAEWAPDFWHSVASEYRDDRSVLFDLYNEPHDIDWQCWEWGCDAYDIWFGAYRAVGMRELVEVVRSTGARQPIMLGGLDWSNDLRGWRDHLPDDPADALVASNHTYDFNLCNKACRKTLAGIAKQYPVVTGELGEGDCDHDYIDPYMRWADRHGISYLGWAWFTDANCWQGPSLIEDYSGTPTPFGVGLREHLRDLHSSRRR